MTAPVSFYFDPGCPWTWNTSRWLVEVAGAEGFDITWRTFSLAIVNEGKEIPEQWRSLMVAGRSATRVVEALRAKDAERGNEAVGRFYTELGRRWHHENEDRTLDSVRAALEAVGLGDLDTALEDDGLDLALRASIDEALELAGPDIGSPVLRIGDRGMHGPIVSPPPTGGDARALWGAIDTLYSLPGVFEVKRGRRSGPVAGPAPAPAGS